VAPPKRCQARTQRTNEAQPATTREAAGGASGALPRPFGDGGSVPQLPAALPGVSAGTLAM
jgi:hypothetical protein